MLKYADVKVVFREVPDEIALAINITNCPCHCKGCHSEYLANDFGEVLDEASVDELISKVQPSGKSMVKAGNNLNYDLTIINNFFMFL